MDIDKERISLGIKQLTDDPFAGQMDSHRKGEVVTCTVTALTDNGIEVSVGDSLTGFIRRPISAVTVPSSALTVSPLARRSMR